MEVTIAGGEKDAIVVDEEEVRGSEVGIDEFHVDWAGHGYMVEKEGREEKDEEREGRHRGMRVRGEVSPWGRRGV